MKHHSVRITIISILFFLSFLIYRLVNWAYITFDGLTFEKIVFQLQEPLQGTYSSTIDSAFDYCLFPALGCTMLLLLVLTLCDRGKYSLSFHVQFKKLQKSFKLKIWPVPFSKIICLLMSFLILSTGTVQANSKFGVLKYIHSQMHPTNFIEANYVNPATVKLTFPAQKRNLIFIYLESMESTYADSASGGAFDQNYIPELTQLANQNINFSSTGLMGGSLAVSGTQWTMGAMFSTSTGLPLDLPAGGNSANQYAKFFPGVTSLGDLLKKNGYNNVLFLGSDATFGGRKLFYTQHGSYEICDYNDAKSKKLIPSNYHVWWGFEDQKLFELAESKLKELGHSSQPFNFTMLTADTHEPDGYRCKLCNNQFGNKYANVIACSSRQVSDFVSWIKQQDFYKNTTIIITGDHQTMNTTLCSKVAPGKRSVYDCFINAVPPISRDKMKNRRFSSLDLCPTALASLGVQIEGDQLGLGVSLFSGKQTLLEKYGDGFSDQLSMKSDFYNKKLLKGE